MSLQKIIIGTRGSRLALAQTDLVIARLQAQNPGLEVATKVIVTKGDTNQAPIPLDTVGKAWFTQEIEDALLAGEIDLAIHSLKDLPPEVPAGLRVAPILERDDARDVLVAKAAPGLDSLPQGAIVGTDSIRRKAQLLRLRPDLVVRSVRGNVETRLRKLIDEEYDGVVLAAAGLNRLGLADKVTQYLEPADFVPAPGQAVLAAEARADATDVWALLEQTQDAVTLLAWQAEQAFTDVIGGGCKLPVGCYVVVTGERAVVYGMVGSMDATQAVIATVGGSRAEVVELARGLARQLMGESVRQGCPSE